MSKFIAPPSNRPQTVQPAPFKRSFDILDLKQYFHVVMKRIWVVALCFVLSLTVMVVILLRHVPTYSCRATLLLSRGLPVPASLRQSEMEPLGDFVSTQQRILQSSLLLQRARERLNRPVSEVSQKILKISSYPVGKTAFMAIQVESLEPLVGAEMANALAQEYLDFKAEERMDTSQATVISLTQQANRLHEELKKAEAQTVAFARENSVVAIQERGNIAATHLAALAAKAAGFRTERMFLEAQQPLLAQASDEAVLAALASPIPPYSATGGQPSIAALGDERQEAQQGNPSVEGLLDYGVVSETGWSSLKRKKAELETRMLEYRKTYRDAHPLMQEAMAELDKVNRQLEMEMQFALRQYGAKLEALAIKEQAAKRVEQEWEEQALDVSRKSQEYSAIKRNSDRLQRLYDLVFNRLKEIDISVGIEPESVRIMELAKPATSPVAPRKLQNLFMAALIGIGIGLALVFGLEYIDDSIRYPEEVAHGLGLPFFGLVPAANWDPNDLRSHLLANIDQKSGLVEAYRNVRSSLLFGAAEDKIRSIVFTSAVPKEGKTTTCINMAISLAQAGARVLVVDGDLRRGELHKFFGMEGGRGLSDILSGQSKPEAVIQRTHVPNLDLVATGSFPPNPAELMFRPELHSFLEYAKRTYDRILIDGPPVLAVSEASILGSIGDGAIMVVWAGHTSRKLAHLALQQLREKGTNMLGCVLNNLDFGRVGYYYYSTYYGYYDYDYANDRKQM